MEVLLSKVTQQAMNYAIRSGVAITTTYAINQLSHWLKTAPTHLKQSTRDDLVRLKMRLETKMKIISPAIDMIELIAARGNTSLESAVSLTTAIRRDMGALACQISELMDAGDQTPLGDSRAKSVAEIEASAQRIKQDLESLLFRIEDAVPLINLAITTSGVKLSTSLPSTVSPSRLLQASTFMTAGDSQYVMNPGASVQVGPAFTLTMFMLFGAHTHRPHDAEKVRQMTWKEVMHKACVKLMRVPLSSLVGSQESQTHLPADSPASEFAYRLVLVEDLDDDRVHSFGDGEEHPSPFEGVELAGLREYIPIHQISKIFYADTGKILDIGSDASTNRPVLLLKRDINAPLPRQLVERDNSDSGLFLSWDPNSSLPPRSPQTVPSKGVDEDSDSDDSDPNAQLLREASLAMPEEATPPFNSRKCGLPPDLDPEWVAFEVYVAEEDGDDAEDDAETADGENSELEREFVSDKTNTPSFSPSDSRGVSHPSYLASTFSRLSLGPGSPPVGKAPTSAQNGSPRSVTSSRNCDFEQSLLLSRNGGSQIPALPPLKTSLSLLELLMRLASLQQFTQSSHLSTPDELLNFFLSESSTVGAGSDSNLRQRIRRAARQKVGFDPYDESPVKFRSEDDIQNADYGSVYSDAGVMGGPPPPGFDYDMTPRSSPAPVSHFMPGGGPGGAARRGASPYVQSPLGRAWSPHSMPPPSSALGGPHFFPQYQPYQQSQRQRTPGLTPGSTHFQPFGTPKSPVRPESPTRATPKPNVTTEEKGAPLYSSVVAGESGAAPDRKPPVKEHKDGTTPNEPEATNSANVEDAGTITRSREEEQPPATPPPPSKTAMSTAEAAGLSPSYPVPSIED